MVIVFFFSLSLVSDMNKFGMTGWTNREKKTRGENSKKYLVTFRWLNRSSSFSQKRPLVTFLSWRLFFLLIGASFVGVATTKGRLIDWEFIQFTNYVLYKVLIRYCCISFFDQFNRICLLSLYLKWIFNFKYSLDWGKNVLWSALMVGRMNVSSKRLIRNSIISF